MSDKQSIGVLGWLRWAWRQLTSMRVAIILLLILIVAIIPASFLPQRSRDAAGARAWIEDNGTWGEILDKAGFFNMFTAPWFAAIYILLFISLVGCVIPRSIQLVRDIAAGPGRIPTNLSRFENASFTPGEDLDSIYDRAEKVLRRRYRLRRTEAGISAENGYLRQGANLVFHLALLGLLIVLFLGQVLSYRGQAVLVEGGSFVNSVLAYDTFEKGDYFNDSELDPFIISLVSMNPAFNDDGTPASFSADLQISEDGVDRDEVVRPNYPVNVAGSNIYLSGNGYAPRITVTDSAGNVAYEGHVILPDISSDYISRGIIKVPDTTDQDKQLAFEFTLFPTAVIADDVVSSIHPDAHNPALTFTTWYGDLGLDSGIPENVYVLNKDGLEVVEDEGGLAHLETLTLGEKVDLPDGLGSIEFTSLERFAALDVRHDPTLGWLLFWAVLAFGGIAISLLLPGRRLWIAERDGQIVVAGMGRKHDGGLAKEISVTLEKVKGETWS